MRPAQCFRERSPSMRFRNNLAPPGPGPSGQAADFASDRDFGRNVQRPWPAPADAGLLPLCSFGPGGAYVVDWQVLGNDVAIERRVFPPRTLISALHRVTNFLAGDIKGWLIATHPGRQHRADSCPAALEP